jgi:hypothetical protein
MIRRAALLAVLLLGGCSTPYQENGFTGGVTAVRVSADVWRIEASGNGYTSSATIQDYALLKSAETTKAAGGTHFVVVDGKDTSATGVYTGPAQSTTTFSGNQAFTTTTPGARMAFNKPGQDTYIRVIRLQPGQNPGGAYSADEIIQFIGPRIKRG